jgi:hypothetical protein
MVWKPGGEHETIGLNLDDLHVDLGDVRSCSGDRIAPRIADDIGGCFGASPCEEPAPVRVDVDPGRPYPVPFSFNLFDHPLHLCVEVSLQLQGLGRLDEDLELNLRASRESVEEIR